MKKFLSVLCAAAMLFILLYVNIAADTTEHVVGNHGDSGTVSDGDADIPGGSSASGDVTLNLGTVNHRYAVDVTFPVMTFDVGGLTWNVNTLTYDVNGEAMSDKTLTITVTNYSDLPVVATGAVGPLTGDATAASISLAMTPEKTETEIAKVTPGGSAQTATLEASLTSADWTDSVNALVASGKTGSITIGTITVTIAKPTEP